MKFHVKAFYPEHSFKDGRVIGCVLYTDDNQHRADRVRDHLREKGVARGLCFTHDENGKGTTSLIEYDLTETA